MDARKKKRLAVRALMVALGLGLGLFVAEQIFSARDAGAFPHLNVYVADADLGVRLRPLATEKIAFNGNPVTDVRIGPEGYRGAGLPPGAADEIIVVGDSQVFGLGVQEEETFSAVLAKAMPGRTVINAGIPTYGPHEYAAVVKSLLESRHPDKASSPGSPGPTVVYVVNLANDLFEASRRNVERHAVWDGWAVRKETAPANVTQFPGRTFLYRESHLFFALRGVGVTPSAPAGFSSEGSWKDLALVAKDLSAGESAEATFVEQRKKQEEALQASQLEVEKVLQQKHPELVSDQAGQAYAKAHGSPSDIVVQETHAVPVEEGRDRQVTVDSLVAGAEVRRLVEARIRREVEVESRAGAADTSLKATFQERLEKQRKLDALLAAPLQKARESSPMAPHLTKMKELCDAHGARLVVVALPIDVQVSATEWEKYGVATPPIDVASTAILADDILGLSANMGVSALDPTAALAQAEPGAFLRGDLHMTAKGHAALATALAATLREAPPVPEPPPLALPEGRTRAPGEEEWQKAIHAGFVVPALFDKTYYQPPLDCGIRNVREWVRIVCKKDPTVADPYHAGSPGPRPVSLTPLRASRDTMSMTTDTYVSATVPMDGKPAVIAIAWESGNGEITIEQKADAITLGWSRKDHLAVWDFDQPAASAQTKKTEVSVTPGAKETCACHEAVTKSPACETFPGAPDADCVRTYGGDCKKLLRCQAGDPFMAPKCLPGWRHAGALEHCFQTCGDAAPCKVGACTQTQGVSLCL